MSKRAKTVLLVLLAVSGVLLFIFNCVFDPIFSIIMHTKMRQMLALGPHAYSFNYWQKPPLPVMFQIFVFDIVNPDEVLKGGAPTVLERGPYVYRVTLEKENITFNDNHTVTYRQRQTFVFDRNMSVGSENDTFTTINAPLFTVGALLQFESPFVQEAVNLLMEGLGEKPLIRVSVHDIFWGYDDAFLRLAKDVLDIFHVKSDLITGVFGYYMGKNATDDGLYTVHTGTDDLSKFLIIDRWNGNKYLDFWSTQLANMINGTDGSLYPPFVTTDRVLQMFDSNLYRSMSMVYNETSKVQGIPTMKFIVKEDEFANQTINPWNAGFCTPKNHCLPSGVLNSSAMGHGAPLYVSLPHFLGGDPYYFRLVKGLKPDRQKHQPYFHLHQLTGVCLSAGRRYQLNVQMKEYPFLSKTRGLSLAYVPALWINGLAEIDSKVRDLFQNQIETPLAIVTDFHYSLFGLAPVMAAVPAFILYWQRRRGHKKSSKDVVTNGAARPSEEPDETTPILNGNATHVQWGQD